MGSNTEGRNDLNAAAELHAACREVDGAIADLAARPLDERVAARMRAVLDGPQLQSARQTLAQMVTPGMTARQALTGPAVPVSPRRLTVVSQARPQNGGASAAVEAPPGDDAEEPDRARGAAEAATSTEAALGAALGGAA